MRAGAGRGHTGTQRRCAHAGEATPEGHTPSYLPAQARSSRSCARPMWRADAQRALIEERCGSHVWHRLAHLNSAECIISEGLPWPSSTPESSALLRQGLGWSPLSLQRASWVPGSGSNPSPTWGSWVSSSWASGFCASPGVSSKGRGVCPGPPPPPASSWPAAAGLPGTCSGWPGPAGSWWPPPDVTVLGLSMVKR